MRPRTTPDRRAPRQAGTSRAQASSLGPTPVRTPAVGKRGSAEGSADLGGVGAHNRSALGELWRRGQHGWPARFPVAQFPNAPLLAALAGLSASGVTDGSAHPYARAAFYAGLAAWAWGELSEGANWMRRASVSSAGAQGNQESYRPLISENGNLVGFTSYSTNLGVNPDTNHESDVFVRTNP